MPSPFPRFDEWNSIQCAIPGGPRDKFASATVDGQHFLIGGQNGDNEPLDTVFAYDSTSNEWTEHTRLPEPRFRCSATAIDNHRLMLIGGYSETTNRSTLVYDTTTRLWTPLPDLNIGRWKAAIVSTNNKVYVIGGRSVNGRERSIEELDLSRNPRRWSVLPQELATKREGCRAVVHPRNNDSIIVVGGFNGRDRYLTTCEIVNVGQGHGEATGTLPPMTSPRKDHGLVLLDNRFLIAIGGSNGSPLPSVEMLQLDHTNHGHRNGWCRLPQMQTARQDGAAFLSGHDQILVVAGHISDNGMATTMEQLVWLHDNDEYEQQEQWHQQRGRAAPADEHEQQPQWQQQRGRAAPAAAYDQQPQCHQQRGRQQRGRAAPADDPDQPRRGGRFHQPPPSSGQHQGPQLRPPPEVPAVPGGSMDHSHKDMCKQWIKDRQEERTEYIHHVEETIQRVRDEREERKARNDQRRAGLEKQIATLDQEDTNDQSGCDSDVERMKAQGKAFEDKIEKAVNGANRFINVIEEQIKASE